MMHFTCPVCAYTLMPYPADEGNICPCCGTEFGYDDLLAELDRRARWRQARASFALSAVSAVIAVGAVLVALLRG